jgi:hypothetical protein
MLLYCRTLEACQSLVDLPLGPGQQFARAFVGSAAERQL